LPPQSQILSSLAPIVGLLVTPMPTPRFIARTALSLVMPDPIHLSEAKTQAAAEVPLSRR
jgi:hypothetical protein